MRLLVVDDFDTWRRLVCSMLGAKELIQVVGEATNGREAVERAQELKPDLVLLDIRLPRLSGIEAGSKIRELVPEVKILFLTQNNDAHVITAALSNGAHGYLLKSDARHELLPAIDAVLRGEKFLGKRLRD